MTAIRRRDGAESEQSRYYLLSEAGAEFGPVGIEPGFNARQAEKGGLGLWLSHQHPVQFTKIHMR